MLGASARYSRTRVPVETSTPPWEAAGRDPPPGCFYDYAFTGAGYSTPKVSAVTFLMR